MPEQLSDDEIRLVRTMMAQAVLKDAADDRAFADLMIEVRHFREDIGNRVTRLERFSYLILGGVGMLVTGLPAAAYLVNLLDTSP